mgnify:CR=1 FL=1
MKYIEFILNKYMDNNEFIMYIKNHTRQETATNFNLTISKVDKLSKKLNLPRKIFKHKDINQDLSSKQIELLIGSMLGDGSLSVVGKHNRKNSKFQENHSIAQYEYLHWKQQILLPFSCPIYTKETIGRKNINGKIECDSTKSLITCMLNTITHPFFTELEKKWYLRNKDNEYELFKNKRIKIIPNDLILTEFIISVWFFDDGSNSPKNRQTVFNTQSYTKDECFNLIDKLKEFNINCGLVKNRDKFVIQTKASSYLNIIDLVSAHLPCESLRYKIDLSQYKPPNYSTRFQKNSPSL